MADELVYDACLEVYPDGPCLAQLIDLPACFARGTDEAQALASLELSIPNYVDWLGRHDEYTPVMRGPFRAVAAETQRMPDAATGAFFAADALELSADDFEWYTTLLDWSYQDHEVLLTTVPGDVARESAASVSERQMWLISHISQESDRVSPTLPSLGPSELVAFVRKLTRERIQSAPAVDRSLITDSDGERWSLRKVLRRSILLINEALDALV